MCDRNHYYIVEVVGQPIRYAGSDAAEAVNALLTIDSDGGEEGYVVAERIADHTYCPGESSRVEATAICQSVPV